MQPPSMFLPGASGLPLDEALSSFSAQGYARLGRMVSDAGLEALRARADELMLGQVAYPGLFFQMDAPTGNYGDLTYGRGWQGPSLEYRKLEKLELDPLFFAYLSGAPLERVARRLILGEIVLYRATLFSKSAGGGSDLPWHQDGGNFWGLDRDPFLQIWTALDDAPEGGGCVEVLPGSHLHGLASPGGGVVQPDMLALRQAEASALRLPARAGEVLLLHNHLWHRSARSTSGKPRRALTVCYMTAETRCMRKRREKRRWVSVFPAATGERHDPGAGVGSGVPGAGEQAAGATEAEG
jgi:phytanoyl-CoA hydroxylase